MKPEVRLQNTCPTVIIVAPRLQPHGERRRGRQSVGEERMSKEDPMSITSTMTSLLLATAVAQGAGCVRRTHMTDTTADAPGSAARSDAAVTAGAEDDEATSGAIGTGTDSGESDAAAPAGAPAASASSSFGDNVARGHDTPLPNGTDPSIPPPAVGPLDEATTATSGSADASAGNGGAADGVFARATLEPRSGSTVTGTVELAHGHTAQDVIVSVTIQGATPGPHGIHIHEHGDCGDTSAAAAGAHFNPSGDPHAGPSALRHHAGDLGNIDVEANGTGHLEIMLHTIPGVRSPTELVGRSVVVHERVDDLSTQPSGDSGSRIACGVIAAAESPTAH
jgi:Cu-Zn family superoxide dismutase